MRTLLITMVVLGLLLCPSITTSSKVVRITHDEDTCTVEEPKVFTPEQLWKELVKQGVEYPDVAYRQAVLETTKFTSKSFTIGNNLFGMKVPRKRTHLAIGEYLGHAAYTDWVASVKDYKLWQQQWRRIHYQSKKHYYALLGTKYAQDPIYVEKVQKRRVPVAI